MKYLFFGGSFNPICNHHLWMAQCALDSGDYDCVVFIPAYEPPHKENLISFEHRMNMVNLAIRKNGRFKSWDVEKPLYINSNGTVQYNYTIDTVNHIKGVYDLDKVDILVGVDSINYIHSWHNYEELLKNVKFVTIPRAISFIPSVIKLLADGKLNIQIIDCPISDISATYIRQRYVDLRSNKYFVPKKVDKYIKQHRLYEEWEK